MQATKPVNVTKRHTEWSTINWRQADRAVRNLRQRIFRATQASDLKKVRSLQKLMLHSHSNTLMSVRRVTQINKGKNTAGVDKLVVKTPSARGKLVDEIETYQPWKAKPARRVHIPKQNGKFRPLGIPTIIDRALQAKVKNALEPYWEARFEGISYGFRPGRGCHDAISKIYILASPHKRKRWIVDADIKGAFDNISHEYLLETIGGFPARELIKQWLKAGYMQGEVFYDTEAGTPQGAVISPLLANVALHGMEQALDVKHDNRGYTISKRAVVRYSDDFVVFCESREDAQASIQILTDWLAKRGLSLSKEKTRIVHLTEGFDFLGFNIRHYKAPKTSRSGYKLLIKPSNESVKNIRKKLREQWQSLRGSNAIAVMKQLNPIIRGWANYFRIGVATRTFNALDNWMYLREILFIRYRHPKKNAKWRKERYFGRLNSQRQDNWVFGDKLTGGYLLQFSWFPIERHVMVKGKASPDDPSLRDYWMKRQKAKAKTVTPSEQKVAKSQDHICRLCGMSLYNDEELQKHHKEPKRKGGKDDLSNLTLVHLYCHQQIHSGKQTPVAVTGEPLLL